MNALSKSTATLAVLALVAAAPAQAGMGSCMPMAMMPGAGAPSCQGQPAAQEPAQACPVPENQADRSCMGNSQMAGMMGDMAAGGMGIAMAVLGALFGPPVK